MSIGLPTNRHKTIQFAVIRANKITTFTSL